MTVCKILSFDAEQTEVFWQSYRWRLYPVSELN